MASRTDMKGAAQWCANSMFTPSCQGHSHFNACDIARFAVETRVKQIKVCLLTGNTDPTEFLTIDSFSACVRFHCEWLPSLFREKCFSVDDVSTVVARITPDWNYLDHFEWDAVPCLPMKCRVEIVDTLENEYVGRMSLFGFVEKA